MGNAPTKSLRVNPHPQDRIVIHFTPRACCGKSDGFDFRDQGTMPAGLERIGVDQIQWLKWVRDYEENVAPHSNLFCWIFCLVVAWMFLIPGLILTFCYDYGTKSPFQRAVRDWLHRVNAAIEAKGGYAKFQTMVEQYGRARIETSSLSFALTKAESDVLREEPVLVTMPCCDCCQCCFSCCAIERNRVV